MTVRKRTSSGRTVESIAARIPGDLKRLPTTGQALPSEPCLAVYRKYSAALEDAVWTETRRDDWELTLAVASALGTDLSSWYQQVSA